MPLTPLVTAQLLTLIVVAVMYEFAVAVQVTTLAPSVNRTESPVLTFPRSAVTVYVAVPIVVFAPMVGLVEIGALYMPFALAAPLPTQQ